MTEQRPAHHPAQADGPESAGGPRASGATGPQHGPDDAARLADRYGAPRAPRRRTLVVVGAILLACGVAGAAWLAFGPSDDGVRGKTFGFSVLSSEEVEIRFDVAKPQDATVVCTLDAMNAGYAQVGTKDVTIGPSDAPERRYTTTIATSEEAVTAVVDSCRIAD
ncbi:DUF4307 domain-containing protein [Sanguibacter suaedae]|uniref:DUF4307 domain-containing protein n=1 Tax=Sanguibacter suaedae TaxID=2795737 RepID=A0A934M6W7_9MICO|nr:DUF4307 domain-containing protein [Sanguibacter suaedae]MBI9114717.1 DUF4307 domain-containing protein [Sanguibacter suaedae]